MATNNDTKSSARLAAENLFGNFPKAPSQEESSTADTEYEEVGTARKARRGRKINGFAHAAYHEEAKMQPIPVKRAAGRPPKDKPYSAMIRVRVFQETAEACMARGGSAFIRGVLEMATGEPSEEVIAKNAPKSRRMSESAITAAGLRRVGYEGFGTNIKRLNLSDDPAEPTRKSTGSVDAAPVNLSQFFIRNAAQTYVVVAEGDSMVDAGINDGDILVVDRSVTAKNGDIVLAYLDGAFTVKRVRFATNDKVTLLAENKLRNYPPIEPSEDDFHIEGVVTGLMRKLRF